MSTEYYVPGALARVNDGLRSLTTGLGYISRDKSETVEYYHRILTDDQLSAAYKGWIGRHVVEIPPEDAVRKWRSWRAENSEIEDIERIEKTIGIRQKIHQAMVWGRLWGGGALIIGANDRQTPDQPLNLDAVSKGDLKYVTAVVRRDLTAGPLEMDIESEFYGRPEYYFVNRKNGLQLKIHPSRLVIFTGEMVADPWITTDSYAGWGTSVIQTIYEAMRNTDSAQANAAALIFEANVDVFGIPNLMQHLGNAEYENRFIQRIELAALGKSTTRALLMDAAETYNRKQLTFAGLQGLLETLLLTVSGASGIPMTRFIGQSPAGLNSTGDGDMKNYYERISAIQTLKIEPAMWRLDECLIRSALGDRPEDIWFEWDPLQEMSEKERAEIGKMTAETLTAVDALNIYTPEEMLKISTNAFCEAGVFPGIDSIVAETPEAERDNLLAETTGAEPAQAETDSPA